MLLRVRKARGRVAPTGRAGTQEPQARPDGTATVMMVAAVWGMVEETAVVSMGAVAASTEAVAETAAAGEVRTEHYGVTARMWARCYHVRGALDEEAGRR